MTDYYSEEFPPYTVANGQGGNRVAANQPLYQRFLYNNSGANAGGANTGVGTLVFEDNYERFGTTKATDCGSYWLCENLPEGNKYRIILKFHANPQVRAAPGEGRRVGYPKRHNNWEGNDLSVSGNLLEFPLLPGTCDIWVNGTRPGPVRAIYQEGGGDKGNVVYRPYDVVYHDPTKPGSLDFTKAAERHISGCAP